VRTDPRRHTHFAWPTINLQPPATTPTSAHFLLPIPPKLTIMSDGEIEVESPAGYAVLPKEVTDEIGSVKLFNKARPWRHVQTHTVLTLSSGPTRRSKSATSPSRTFPRSPDTHALKENMAMVARAWTQALRTCTDQNLQRLHPDPLARLHLTFRRPLCCQAIQEGAVPHH
jgi:hypothetical protein